MTSNGSHKVWYEETQYINLKKFQLSPTCWLSIISCYQSWDRIIILLDHMANRSLKYSWEMKKKSPEVWNVLWHSILPHCIILCTVWKGLIGNITTVFSDVSHLDSVLQWITNYKWYFSLICKENLGQTFHHMPSMHVSNWIFFLSVPLKPPSEAIYSECDIG